jgi:hypothetical protein
MDNDKKGIISLLLTKRSDFVKLILGAFILALGTSLLANYLTYLLKNQMVWVAILSGGFIVSVLTYLVLSIISENTREIEIDSVIVFDRKNKSVFPILRYEFSESLNETLTAVFIEDEALKKYWEDDFKDEKEKKPHNGRNTETHKPEDTKETSLKEMSNNVGYFSIVRVTADDVEEKTKSNKILEEAVEYIIIEQLSTHLSTYFNDYDEHDKLIKEYTRSDFPEILLQNRIINLLSTPFEDRAIFVKAGMTENPPEGEIVSIYGGDGSRFTRFDLVLPSGSTVKRPSDGVIVLENKRISLRIEVHYDGFTATLPGGFEHNYLGIIDRELDARQLNISLSYRIKPETLFFRSKWNYHNWVDSFAKDLFEFASFDNFIEKINWETTFTGIVTASHRRRILKEREEEKKKSTTTNDGEKS